LLTARAGSERAVITRAVSKLAPPRAAARRVDAHPGIVVHCTGGVRPSSLEEAIKRWRVCHHGHTAPQKFVKVEVRSANGIVRVDRRNVGGNGWTDIGYHFGVTPAGEILEGRGWNVLGAHAKGHNACLGIVVLGRGTELSDPEAAALVALVDEHLARGGGRSILPHSALSRRRCPGPVVTAWLDERYPGGLA
jgi:hypothetical protein